MSFVGGLMNFSWFTQVITLGEPRRKAPLSSHHASGSYNAHNLAPMKLTFIPWARSYLPGFLT